MARQLDREQISPNLRREVYARDKHSCQKCGKCKRLEIHHIIPSADKGLTVLENLITLCKQCHYEWEHIVYPGTDQITFHEWLAIPSAIILITLFTKEIIFDHEITWKEFRDNAIKASQTFKDVCQLGERYWQESYNEDNAS